MKKIAVILLILPVLILCAFSFHRKKQAYIMLSSGTISPMTAERIERYFYPGQRIYYAVISPDGFSYQGVRMQLSKQDDKTSNWGFSIIQSRDFIIDMAQNQYNDHITVSRPGRYILQFFYLNNKDYPFAHTEFMVE
jgi:hypothetical protein